MVNFNESNQQTEIGEPEIKQSTLKTVETDDVSIGEAANNAALRPPKIFLETMTSGTARILFILNNVSIL